MTTTMPPAFFLRDGDDFVPTPIANGPWGPTISGNMVGGILGHVLESAVQDQRLRPARLTVDLLRPAAMAPLGGRSAIVRRGRRLTLVEAELLQRDTVVARATGLFLRAGEQPPGDTWSASVQMPPMPPLDVEPDAGVPLLIWVHGKPPVRTGPSSTLDAWQHDGPKSLWVRDVVPLIDGVVTTPLVRVAMAGDMASSLTHYGTTGLQYINADFTLSLSRLPVGPDIGLTALTFAGHDGIATGTAVVFRSRGTDRHGHRNHPRQWRVQRTTIGMILEISVLQTF